MCLVPNKNTREKITGMWHYLMSIKTKWNIECCMLISFRGEVLKKGTSYKFDVSTSKTKKLWSRNLVEKNDRL